MSPKKLMEGGALHMKIDEGEDAYRVSESAYSEMVKRGIRLPEKPDLSSQFVDEDGGPVLPANLQVLTDHQIGELYGVLDDYYAYVAGQLADVQNQYEEGKEIFEFILSKVRLAKEGKQKDKDDLSKSDRRYVIANAKRLELKCLYNLLVRVVQGVESKLKRVSRSITLRENEMRKGARRAAVDARRQLSHTEPPKTVASTKPTRVRPSSKIRRKPPKRKSRK